MKKQKTHLSEIKLIGLTDRTNNKDEMDPQTAKIGKLVALYWGKEMAKQIQHRLYPGMSYS